MFCTLFRSSPKMPDSWNLCFLWAAQCIIAAAIASDEETYKKIGDEKELTDKILEDLKFPLFRDMDQHFFPDEDFKRCFCEGFTGYLQSEAQDILTYIRTHDSLTPVLISESIIQALKENVEFRKYIM